MNANAYGGELGRVLEWVDVCDARRDLPPPPGRAGLRVQALEPRARARSWRAPPSRSSARTRETVKAVLADMRGRRRKEAQPSGIKTFGSTFKNPDDPARRGPHRGPAARGRRLQGTPGRRRALLAQARELHRERGGASHHRDVLELIAEGRRRVQRALRRRARAGGPAARGRRVSNEPWRSWPADCPSPRFVLARLRVAGGGVGPGAGCATPRSSVSTWRSPASQQPRRSRRSGATLRQAARHDDAARRRRQARAGGGRAIRSCSRSRPRATSRARSRSGCTNTSRRRAQSATDGRVAGRVRRHAAAAQLSAGQAPGGQGRRAPERDGFESDAREERLVRVLAAAPAAASGPSSTRAYAGSADAGGHPAWRDAATVPATRVWRRLVRDGSPATCGRRRDRGALGAHRPRAAPTDDRRAHVPERPRRAAHGSSADRAGRTLNPESRLATLQPAGAGRSRAAAKRTTRLNSCRTLHGWGNSPIVPNPDAYGSAAEHSTGVEGRLLSLAQALASQHFRSHMESSGYLAVIKVVGVGGGGTNAVNRMVDAGLKGVEFIAVNTDNQALLMIGRRHQAQHRHRADQGPGRGSEPGRRLRRGGGEPRRDQGVAEGRGHGVRDRRRGRRHRHGRRAGGGRDRQGRDRRADRRRRDTPVRVRGRRAARSRPRPGSGRCATRSTR